MAAFRIEKTQNYTIMSNHHLRNANLSLKAKGLLSQMLSLPENWDYTLKGLSHINRESVDAIRTAIHELERAGYITRSRERKENGQLGGTEYIIHEQPPEDIAPDNENTTHISGLPTQEKPMWENPIQVNSTLENPTQINKEYKAITEKTNTDLSNTHQSIYPATPEYEAPDDGIDRIDRKTATEVYRDIIKDNIEYDSLCISYDPERVTEILELILETVCTPRKYIRIGGEDIPAEVVSNTRSGVAS